MKNLTFLLILFVFTIFNCSPEFVKSNDGIPQYAEFFPLRLLDVRIVEKNERLEYLSNRYINRNDSLNYRQHKKKLVGYYYELEIAVVKFSNDLTFTQPFGIAVDFSNGETELFLLNAEETEFFSDETNYFSVFFETDLTIDTARIELLEYNFEEDDFYIVEPNNIYLFRNISLK